MLRLGHVCHSLGSPEPKLRAAQRTRWQKGLVELGPIYAHNAETTRRAIEHAAEVGLMAFRISTDLFPLLDCDPALRKLVPSFAPLRETVARTGVHISNHPAQFAVLSTAAETTLTNTVNVLRDAGWVMDRIGAAGSLTIHGGGVYGDREGAGRRWMANLRKLPAPARRRVVLENDEHCWTVPELLAFTGGSVPIVFDKLHWQANARSAPYETELGGALATWPETMLPELHFSEQEQGKVRGAHATHITGKGLLLFLEEVTEASKGRECVVIVEAKRKDLAIARAVGELGGASYRRLLQLVPDLRRAPKGWPKRSAVIEAALDRVERAA